MTPSFLRYLKYAIGYYWRYRTGRNEPFIGGLVLNASCNLGCPQCRVANGADRSRDPSFAEVCRGLDEMRRQNIRNLAITGGEPFFWRDGACTVHDVIAYARRVGFLAVTVYTNGTLGLDCDCDCVFVGMDGVADGHNRLRGDGVFELMEQNLRQTRHPNIIINFTVNRHNADQLADICNFVQNHPMLKGVFFYFHTPYYGQDELFQSLPEKRPLVDEILRLQKAGYPVCNSQSALRSFAADRWQRPSDLCVVWERGKFFRCCRSLSGNLGCPDCGYLGYLELQEIMKLSPSAVRAACRYLR